LQTYLEYTGQVDSEGRKFGTNTDTDGRFHSKWLNMMYPRLYLARNLLREDGVIFVTIDDGEVSHLRSLMDELFGEEHFLAVIAWEKRYTRSNNARLFYSLKDSIVAYRRSDAVSLLREARTDKAKGIYDNPDNDQRGAWTSSSYVNPARKEARPNLVYPITNPFSGEVVEHPTHAWKYEPKQHERHVKEDRLWWGRSGGAKYPRLKNFLHEMSEGLVPVDLWDYQSTGTTDEGGLEVKDMFGDAVFDNPKPSRLIGRMLALATTADDPAVVMDFFAGSGATGQAVLGANKQDGGNRKFILVQLPEPTGREDYPTIAEITKERVRRVIQKLNDDDAGKLDLDGGKKQDRGFRVFKLAESNFTTWDAEQAKDAEGLARQLFDHIDHIREGRTGDDLLHEILLKSGFPLATPVETLELCGKTVHSVAGGALLICLDRALTLDLIRAMRPAPPSAWSAWTRDSPRTTSSRPMPCRSSRPRASPASGRCEGMARKAKRGGSEHRFGGDWTEQKLDVVAKYLSAYTKALKKKTFEKLYIDAFAGTGYREAGREDEGAPAASALLFPDLAEAEPQALLEGSARRALGTDPPFDRYVFIERDASRCAQLEPLRTEFPALADAIEIRQGEANSEIQGLCDGGWRTRRAVLFLDPYGMQVEWATIEAVARTQAIDLWILFPLGMGVNRLLKKSGDIPEPWRQALNRLLGTEDWFDEFYRVETTATLFGDEERVVKRSTEVIGKYFNRRLETVFAGVAPEPAVLRNSRNAPLYLLCFAVGNPGRARDIALRIANHILEGVR